MVNVKKDKMHDSLENIPHRKSNRLKLHDYASNGKYFVTICTANKVPYFGNMKQMILDCTEMGNFAIQSWGTIPEHFPFVTLDSFILMPDHIHGIICIKKNEKPESVTNQFGPQVKNLAAVLRGFKCAVTSFARINSLPFQWQSRYYDRVIRNDHQLNLIRQYILENPANWTSR